MKPQIFTAEEYSFRIPLLLNLYPNGDVHSKFCNGFNLKMGKSLIFIGNKRNGRIPFGIHVHDYEVKDILDLISNNNKLRIYWNSQSFQLQLGNDEVFIKFVGAAAFNNVMGGKSTNKPSPFQYKQFISLLWELPYPTGLEIKVSNFLKGIIDRKEYDTNEHKIMSLLSALRMKNRPEIENTLRYFLGRGPGLTPSGDDILIGLLAIDAITRMSSDAFRLTLWELVVNESITTDVSREFLFYALNKEFSSIVKKAAMSIFIPDEGVCKSALETLLNTGHSSGRDTAFGMLLGLIATYGFNNKILSINSITC